MRDSDRVHDKVEATAMKCHLAWVSRDHNFIGAELQRILALRVGSSKSNHMGTEPESELNAHVTEAADPEDVDLLACAEPCPCSAHFYRSQQLFHSIRRSKSTLQSTFPECHHARSVAP